MGKYCYFREVLMGFIPLLFFSCCSESDTHSYMPIFEGFEAPSMAQAGDSVTVIARQLQKGHLIYHAKYTWSYSYTYEQQDGQTGSAESDKTYQNVVYDVQPEDPQYKFRVPDSALSVIITFVGDYSYSGEGDSRYDGSNTGSGSGTMGHIRPVTSNVLGGQSKGSVRIRIK